MKCRICKNKTDKYNKIYERKICQDCIQAVVEYFERKPNSQDPKINKNESLLDILFEELNTDDLYLISKNHENKPICKEIIHRFETRRKNIGNHLKRFYSRIRVDVNSEHEQKRYSEATREWFTVCPVNRHQ